MPVPCPWPRGNTDLSQVQLTPEQKSWLGHQLAQNLTTVAKLTKRFNLSARLLYKYAEKAKEGCMFQSVAGRPPLLTPRAESDVLKSLSTSRFNVTTKDFKEIVVQQVSNTALARGKALIDTSTISKRSLARLETKLSIKTGNAEATTSARAQATSDLRNAVTFAAMNALMVENIGVHPGLILNADATQFTVGIHADGLVEVKHIGRSSTDPLKVMPSKIGSGPVGLYTVKYYLLIGATGFAADAGNSFKASKTVNRSLEGKTGYENAATVELLKATLKDHNARMQKKQTKVSTPNSLIVTSSSSSSDLRLEESEVVEVSDPKLKKKKKGLSDRDIKLAVAGILRVQLAMQIGVKPVTIRNMSQGSTHIAWNKS